MAYRKSALLEIGGFDERFRVAGDDVDVCWSLQKRNWKLGFNPAAVVWHHRRNSVRTVFEAAEGLRPSRSFTREKSGLRNTTRLVMSPGRAEYMATVSSRFFAWRPNIPRNFGDCPFQRLYGAHQDCSRL